MNHLASRQQPMVSYVMTRRLVRGATAKKIDEVSSAVRRAQYREAATGEMEIG